MQIPFNILQPLAIIYIFLFWSAVGVLAMALLRKGRRAILQMLALMAFAMVITLVYIYIR